MKPQRLFYILLAIWILADLLQAIVTPVHADEAYYALYGQFLDWGYYDHPPMVALLTALSNALFKGNLSIRFATVLLHGGTVWLVWKTLPHKIVTNKDVWTFFAISASMVMFSVYGFVTTPDAPLLFFTALFFYLYRRYLLSPNWLLAMAIGVTLAAMLYSKYMAVLVAGFVLLSNLKLLKDPKLWIAILLAGALFLPHIFWQLRHNFPSFQYHLLERSSGFRVQYLLEYIPNQLLVFNPVCLCFAVYFCWKEHITDDLFERACLFTIVGFLLFFWVMTVKGHAEPHWTVAASIPMIVLLWQNLRESRWQKWLAYVLAPLACLVVSTCGFVPKLVAQHFSQTPDRYEIVSAVHKKCGQTPAVFVSSFQDPSLYRFYTDDDAYTLSSFYTRRTQFDIWQFDTLLQGKPVCVIDDAYQRHIRDGFTTVDDGNVRFYYREINSFQGANRIQATVDRYSVSGDSLLLDLTLYNPYSQDFLFNHPECPVMLFVGFISGGDHHALYCPFPPDLIIPAKSSVSFSTATNAVPDAPFVICVENGTTCSINSTPVKIKTHHLTKP